MKRLLLAALATTALLPAAAASAADAGTIGATINVAPAPTACLTLSRSTIDYPPAAFSRFGASPTSVVDPLGPIDVASCATGTQQVLVSATDAASGREGVIWRLGEVRCDPQLVELNVFGAQVSAERGEVAMALQTRDNLLTTLAAGATVSVDHTVTMPCDGSLSRLGSASFTINYLAVI